MSRRAAALCVVSAFGSSSCASHLDSRTAPTSRASQTFLARRARTPSTMSVTTAPATSRPSSHHTHGEGEEDDTGIADGVEVGVDAGVSVGEAPGVDFTVGLGLGVDVCVGAAVGVRVGVGAGTGLVGAGVVGFGVGVAAGDRVGSVSGGRGDREADASGIEDLVGSATEGVGSTVLGRADETGPPPPPQAVRASTSDPAGSTTRSRLATRLAYNSPSFGPAAAPTSR